MQFDKQCPISDRGFQTIQAIITEYCLRILDRQYGTQLGGNPTLAFIVLTTPNIIIADDEHPVVFRDGFIHWNARMFDAVNSQEEFVSLAKVCRMRLEEELKDCIKNHNFVEKFHTDLPAVEAEWPEYFEWAREALNGRHRDIAGSGAFSDFSKLMYGIVTSRLYVEAEDPKPLRNFLEFFERLSKSTDDISMFFITRHLGMDIVVKEKLLDNKGFDDVLSRIIKTLKVDFDRQDSEPA